MDYAVCDIESNGLLDTISKIHCMSVEEHIGVKVKSFSLTKKEDIIAYLNTGITLVGHKFITYDIPALEKVYGIKINNRVVDTLAISWYMFPLRKVHGLAEWGEVFGIPKPPVADWENEPIEVYIHRCEQDVRINSKLFTYFLTVLRKVYADGNGSIDELFKYLSFKMDCAREQEELRWKLDIPLCQQYIEELTAEKLEKFNALQEAMPSTIKYRKAEPPAKPFKKDGSLSSTGQAWHNLTMERGLPFTHDQPIKVEIARVPGNPNAPQQKKDWLFSLGWVPQTIKYDPIKDASGNVIGQREIPQINKDDDSGDICDSIKLLYEREPRLVNLESYGMIQHRIGILNGFMSNVSEDGYLKAEVAGFTNTMRFKHSIIVNLPKVSKAYGKYARGVLTCPEGYTLCGSDMSSLEDTTKQHYMYFFDPKYVEEMRTPGFDPHIDIGVLAGLLTKDDEIFFKYIEKAQKNAKKDGTKFEFKPGEKARYDAIKLVRSGKSKKVNFTATYGAGAAKISIASGMSLAESRMMHGIYWERNKAIKQVAKAAKVITVEGQMWLFNPVSKLWYTLRYDKDRFSTLNQSTGVWCFDQYVMQIRMRNIKICGQFHDEVIIPLPLTYEGRLEQHLNNCIAEVNKIVKLNVPLGISVDFGSHYSDIH